MFKKQNEEKDTKRRTTATAINYRHQQLQHDSVFLFIRCISHSS